MTTEASIILDSISPSGARLTTFRLRYPRIIHSEFMTHRVFSRNASSSRAIPISKLIDQVRTDPFVPESWPSNRPGMQGGEPIAHPKAARALWLQAARHAANSAEALADFGVHKQLANRLLEPFLHIDVLVSSTDYTNFFKLRCDAAAQPEIQKLALAMRHELERSIPIARPVHSPFHPDPLVATGKCARVSYSKHDGAVDEYADRALAMKLLSSRHMSPFEHVARAGDGTKNFRGWIQLREEVELSRGRLDEKNLLPFFAT